MKVASNRIVIAFVLGGCAGFALARGCGEGMLHPHWGGAQDQHRLLDQFSSKLKLTTEQRNQVGAILQAKRQKIDALRAEIRPRFEEIRTSTSAEIRRALTPEQQRQFDLMEAQRDARMKRFHDHWRRPGGNG